MMSVDRMKHLFFRLSASLLTTFALAVPCMAAPLEIHNGAIKVSVARDGRMNVYDERSRMTWRQAIPKTITPLAVSKVEKIDARSISVIFKSAICASAVIEIHESEPEVSVSVNPGARGEMQESDRCDWPYPFRPLDRDSEIVWPNRAPNCCCRQHVRQEPELRSCVELPLLDTHECSFASSHGWNFGGRHQRGPLPVRQRANDSRKIRN